MSWKIDPAHSEINFSVRHMMITNVRGRFERFSGEVDFNEEYPAASRLEVEIEAASINTKEEKRDAHLRSVDFFDVENYPAITFSSRRIEVLDDTRGRITGDLTIRGISREVVLAVEYNGQVKSPFGFYSAGFTASTSINRKDWGLTWNVALETGGVLVGDDIKINIEVELIKEQVLEAV